MKMAQQVDEEKEEHVSSDESHIPPPKVEMEPSGSFKDYMV